ncbi:M1 family peptidase [Lysobacter pythonis]|uniref:Aminopeptidase N n=1 Tax=Solilutibacter pythonis TaxID=2483112 RepID=A0A3M2HJ06_9GAMM|nr:M1 family metallopeptidase [Lysobacter pythonis]RMH87903.1 M1 family peptidase [Lysobacter pythonis]
MRHSVLMLSIATALLAAGCKKEEATAPAAPDTPAAPAKAAPAAAVVKIVDEHSYAEPDKVRTRDLALDLAIDFDKKQLAGTATYTLEWLDKTATRVLLDTRELTIEKAEGETTGGQWQPLKFALAPEADKVLGTRLTIETPERPAKVRVTYRTSPAASGLQWLTPAMTEGKKTPFMFSQSQQIHARSWVPLQDTPQVRFTYSARVASPKDVMVLMSADNDPKAARDGDYTFKMPQPIPSYLLAIAAGDLVFKPISARSGVWAEPAMVDKATQEFEDTEKMIDVTEKLYGPYRWDRYDMLVLPPSFPYGGMENPRLTFATPTVIVGDKSLVSLIAHELAHSWSGNLVTFATDRDAWLNEGFTTYVQGRITEAMYGQDMADMEHVIDRDELKKEYRTLDSKLQVMALKPGDLSDPDGASSVTVYTKGAWMLQWLEQVYGREVFDPFLKGYFDHFAFQSITTQQFLDYLKTHLLDKHPGKATMEQVEQWIYQPGIPESAPRVNAKPFGVVDTARIAFNSAGTLPAPQLTGEWSTQEWVHFLEGMPETLPAEKLKQLDAAYHFTGTANGEVAMRWYPLTARSGYAEARPEMAKFLERVGRRKLVMPIYNTLVKTPDGLKFAKDVFAKARPAYHPITTASVEEVIAKAEAGAGQ